MPSGSHSIRHSTVPRLLSSQISVSQEFINGATCTLFSLASVLILSQDVQTSQQLCDYSYIIF